MQGNSIYTGQAGSGSVAPGGVPQNPHTIDGVNYAYQNAAFNGQTVKLVKTNETVGYIQAPLDRWSMFANGHYDFNDYITATFQGNFSRTHTSTIRTAYPTTISSGWTVNVPYDAATNGVASGHPVPTGLATLLNSRPNPNAPWTLTVAAPANFTETPTGTGTIPIGRLGLSANGGAYNTLVNGTNSVATGAATTNTGTATTLGYQLTLQFGDAPNTTGSNYQAVLTYTASTP